MIWSAVVGTMWLLIVPFVAARVKKQFLTFFLKKNPRKTAKLQFSDKKNVDDFWKDVNLLYFFIKKKQQIGTTCETEAAPTYSSVNPAGYYHFFYWNKIN